MKEEREGQEEEEGKVVSSLLPFPQVTNAISRTLPPDLT